MCGKYKKIRYNLHKKKVWVLSLQLFIFCFNFFFLLFLTANLSNHDNEGYFAQKMPNKGIFYAF